MSVAIKYNPVLSTEDIYIKTRINNMNDKKEYLCNSCANCMIVVVDGITKKNGQIFAQAERKKCLLVPGMFTKFGPEYKGDDGILNAVSCTHYVKKKK
jgi:hypothetical protein